MGAYGARLTKGTTSTTIGVGSLEGSASRRCRLVYVSGGSTAAPADNNIVFEVQRSTSTPTGTSVTPKPMDDADVACTSVVKENLTVQGTNTGTPLLCMPCNQKAFVAWYALPETAIVIPATANTGVHFNTPTAGSTPAVAMEIHFLE